MPHAAAILGINELIIEQVHRYEGIEVWARLSLRTKPAVN
jgi:hypothetical protein